MAEPGRGARIRVHPRIHPRTGLPSAKRELAALTKYWGPSIQLSPDIRRDLLRRRLFEIDGDLKVVTDDELADLLHEERRVIVAELAELGFTAEAPLEVDNIVQVRVEDPT